MREDSKLIDAIHRMKPEIDKLSFIGELANSAGDSEFIPATRFTRGLAVVILELILAFEKIYRHVGGLDYTLRCYEASFDCACEYEAESPVVCQGWARTYDSATYIHAWVEVNNEIYDWTRSRKPLDKANYYLELGIESAPTRYSLLEFCKLRIEHGTFGPFN